MSNEKAKNILIVILVVIVLLLTVAVVYNVTTGKNALEMFAASDKQETKDDIDVSSKESNIQISQKDENQNKVEIKEETDNKETIKVVYKNIVETSIEKHDAKKAEHVCSDSDGKVKIDMILPKINIDTKEVDKINKKIEELANKELNNYKEARADHRKDISYSYKYNAKNNILIIYIENIISNECASGYYKLTTYAYDISKDKLLTIKDFGITDEDLKEGIELYLEENDEDMKEILYNCIKDKEYYITEVWDYKIEVSFPIPYDEIRIIYRYD